MRLVVLGAGGFVGGWICEELAGHPDLEIVACVRHWASAVRVARRGLSIVQADLEDARALAAAIEGADVVVNATLLPPLSEAQIVDQIYSACCQAGVRTFLHFSSIAVYGNQTGEIDEDAPLAATDDYGRGKAATEARLVQNAGPGRTRLIILRPSIIYGAFSETWTVRFARRIAHYRWAEFGTAGEGSCNLIYARDLVHAVMAAVEAPRNHDVLTLNINGPEVVTWNEYVRRFGDALGVPNRIVPNALGFQASIIAAAATRRAGRFAKSLLGDVIMKIYLSPRASGQLMQGADTIAKLYPEPGEANLWRQKAVYRWERAAQEIAFRPTTPLQEGLQESAVWCRLHGVVP